ncbi:hypothetical protein Ataiwa_18830 [Algoriphagus taiwanensis]|uniref:Uncharacterized protein n=1 Tax=Algoriphagus taiwanensis TaxID=1445656 RepID=A0ABQ6Q089_9BACT|nr:hypothetical protein Ataiwa_18830 [Algoriphagus taiwanensis]
MELEGLLHAFFLTFAAVNPKLNNNFYVLQKKNYGCLW